METCRLVAAIPQISKRPPAWEKYNRRRRRGEEEKNMSEKAKVAEEVVRQILTAAQGRGGVMTVDEADIFYSANGPCGHYAGEARLALKMWAQGKSTSWDNDEDVYLYFRDHGACADLIRPPGGWIAASDLRHLNRCFLLA